MKFLSLFVLLLPSIVFSELLIMTYQCSFPIFFELQCKTLKAFCKDDYTFVVFDDSQNPEYSKAYQKICKQYGAIYQRIPPSIHTYAYLQREPGEGLSHPTIRNCNAVEFSLTAMGRSHNDLLFILDGDLLPIKPFSMKELLQGYNILGLAQSKDNSITSVSYLWIGFAVLDMGTLPEKNLINFNCGRINNVAVDAGGYTSLYLTKYKNILKIREIGCSIITEETCKKYPELAPMVFWNTEVLLNGHFLHYRGGSNWDHKSPNYHEEKLRLFKGFVEEQLLKTEQ